MKPDLGKALDEALERAVASGDAKGCIEAEAGSERAVVDVVDMDRLGVRVSRVRVERAAPVDVAREAEDWPDRLRALPEVIAPVEVDPRLGGATFRTEPGEVDQHEYFEVEIRGRDVDLRRHRAPPGEEREAIDFTLTRGQLKRVVGGMGE